MYDWKTKLKASGSIGGREGRRRSLHHQLVRRHDHRQGFGQPPARSRSRLYRCVAVKASSISTTKSCGATITDRDSAGAMAPITKPLTTLRFPRHLRWWP